MSPAARLRAVFVQERARFAAVFPDRPLPRLRIERARCVLPDACAFRDFGYTEEVDGGRRDCGQRRVVLHHRLAAQARTRILGVIRHELGHAYDDHLWSPGVEQRADDIAEQVTGVRIRYDRQDVQTVSVGSYPRPSYLPR